MHHKHFDNLGIGEGMCVLFLGKDKVAEEEAGCVDELAVKNLAHQCLVTDIDSFSAFLTWQHVLDYQVVQKLVTVAHARIIQVLPGLWMKKLVLDVGLFLGSTLLVKVAVAFTDGHPQHLGDYLGVDNMGSVSPREQCCSCNEASSQLPQ